MKVLIAFFGLVSFGSIFVGTALGIFFSGFDMGMRIMIASLLVFIFCLFADRVVDR